MQTIYKHVGETPLEALERFRAEQVAQGRVELRDVPMTYAGRLDPMAEGVLLILMGEECKQKEEYLGLDKEYEVEILFGIETDTHDVLGIPRILFSEKGHTSTKSELFREFFIEKESEDNLDFEQISRSDGKSVTSTCVEKKQKKVPVSIIQNSDPNQSISFLKYIGKFIQEYPIYSSKTVNGKQLHTLARSGELPDELPTKEVEIYSIEELERSEISAQDLLHLIQSRIALVKGDFRQAEIMEKWHEVLSDSSYSFATVTLNVSCSSGTYMRSLAHRIGKDHGNGACALGIKRTKIRGLTSEVRPLRVV